MNASDFPDVSQVSHSPDNSKMVQIEHEIQQQEKQIIFQSVIYKVRYIIFLKKKSEVTNSELETNSAAQNCEH